MASLSDMGGRREYFGPIAQEPDEPVFHERWEGRVFGMNVFVQTLLGPPNVDAARYAMERLPREVYMSSYYRRWLGGLETKLVEDGFLTPAEIDARVQGRSAPPAARRVPRVRRALASGSFRVLMRPRFPRWLARTMSRLVGTSRPALSRRRFSVGDRIRVRDAQAAGHTRQPGYVTGKPGVVTAHHGATLFPDAHSVGRRARPQHLYTVAFEGRELWDDAAEPGTEVRVDLFEPYLEQA
jgi:nitrile hydratase